MGKRFSVRLQLQPDVLGKMWDTPTCFPAPAAIPEPQFFLFSFIFLCVGFCGHCRNKGGVGSVAASPSEHSKKQIPDDFISQNSSKSSAFLQGREGDKPFLLCRTSQSLYWSLYWFPVSRWGGASPTSSCLLLQHSQIPYFSQIPFSQACSDSAVLSSQPGADSVRGFFFL